MEVRSLLPVVFSVYMFIDLIVAGESKDETFHVEPGAGTLSVESKLGDIGCTFSYAAQGGTNEEWGISLSIMDEGTATCTIQRGIPSYIFFEKFSLKVTGSGMSIADSEVLSSQRDNKQVSKEEYIIETDTISSVQGKFKNKLEKVAVLMISLREEL